MPDPYKKLKELSANNSNPTSRITPRQDPLFSSGEHVNPTPLSPPSKPLVETAPSRNLRLEIGINAEIEQIVRQQKDNKCPITYDTFYEALILHFQSLPPDQRQKILDVANQRRAERMQTGKIRRLKNSIEKLNE
ncbi:MAG TPA: hypothetical protein V6C65_04215 [Allocoleopsis sp.]